MIKRYIKIFDGYRKAYGTAELKNAKVDPDKGGKLVLPTGDYGWTHKELTEEENIPNYIQYTIGIE